MYCSDTVVKTDCVCQQSATHVSAVGFSAEFPYTSWGRIGMLRLSLTISIREGGGKGHPGQSALNVKKRLGDCMDFTEYMVSVKHMYSVK